MNEEALAEIGDCPAKTVFIELTQGKYEYGYEETRDAWAWFYAGWQACGECAIGVIETFGLKGE
jgi:hypothetical protein